MCGSTFVLSSWGWVHFRRKPNRALSLIGFYKWKQLFRTLAEASICSKSILIWGAGIELGTCGYPKFVKSRTLLHRAMVTNASQKIFQDPHLQRSGTFWRLVSHHPQETEEFRMNLASVCDRSDCRSESNILGSVTTSIFAHLAAIPIVKEVTEVQLAAILRAGRPVIQSWKCDMLHTLLRTHFLGPIFRYL